MLEMRALHGQRQSMYAFWMMTIIFCRPSGSNGACHRKTSGIWLLVRDGCGRAVPFCTADGICIEEKRGKRLAPPYRFLADNPVPIQAVVFRKELYQSCGGLDPGLDALEDWDLWMRMICQSPVWGIEKATSIFRVPADEAAFAKRDAEIAAYRGRLFQKWRHIHCRCLHRMYTDCFGSRKKQRRAGSGGLEDKGDRSDKFRNMAGYSYLTPHIADAWRRLTETGWSRIGRF